MTYEIDPTIDPATNRPIRNPIRLSPPAEQQHSPLTRQIATPEPADFTLPTSAALRRQLTRAEAERDKAVRDNLELSERLAHAAVDRDEARRQADELQAVFDLQYTRTTDAEKRWRAEDPQARGHIAPDLGRLLAWLMADADQAKRQRDSLARRLNVRWQQLQIARAQVEVAYAVADDIEGSATTHAAAYAKQLREKLDTAGSQMTLTDEAKEYLDAYAGETAAQRVNRLKISMEQPGTKIVHLVQFGLGLTRCCHVSIGTLPTSEHWTDDPDKVTCGITKASTDGGSVARVAQETHGSAHIDCVKCGSPNVAPQVQELRDA